ncbi:hypothetical protein RI129_009936 [Pyrocoelia pectoralis]|uniref:Uncharacterized protein n=1 Tax=Pyrocoelia pectoralis TaxID=417401 RepID=A0AAN7VDH5_9COLE
MTSSICVWFAVILIAIIHISFAQSEDGKIEIKQKSLHAGFFGDASSNINNDVKGAIVLKSNLPLSAQTQLAATLTQIYQNTADPMQRLQQFQTASTRMYSMYWSVVSNFENITFYYKYYIYLQIYNDHVLAFGLS